MKNYHEARDALDNALRRADGGLSTDQELKRAEVLALLSISQELSLIRHQGVSPDFDPNDD